MKTNMIIKKKNTYTYLIIPGSIYRRHYLRSISCDLNLSNMQYLRYRYRSGNSTYLLHIVVGNMSYDVLGVDWFDLNLRTSGRC